ncbi:hypothetical protein [Shewanella frigidimarina]|uniref:hypothetical protein n=1 Tax=Shewanella frigidimarina TaxID=56812 RepID=UPI003D79C860
MSKLLLLLLLLLLLALLMVILSINAIALLVYLVKGDTYEVPVSKNIASQDSELDQQKQLKD